MERGWGVDGEAERVACKQNERQRGQEGPGRQKEGWLGSGEGRMWCEEGDEGCGWGARGSSAVLLQAGLAELVHVV